MSVERQPALASRNLRREVGISKAKGCGKVS